MTIEINVEHLVPHLHIHNGLIESLIKHLQVITRTLLLCSQLHISTWGYAILHVVASIRLSLWPIINIFHYN